jgi:hypothetical protein
MTDDLPGRLRVQGPDLIKPNGQPFIGRGLSFGTYGENLEGDPVEVKAMGANLVRNLLRWHGEYGRAEVDARDNNAVAFIKRTNMRQVLDEVLGISAAELWTGLALDSNCVQGGAQNPSMRAYCDPYALFGASGRNGFTDPPLLKLFVIVWQALARAVRPIPRIAWLELLPEPLPHAYGPEWAPRVAEVYREIIAGVREVDTDTPIVIGPRDAYNADYLEEIYLAERDDVIYTFNILSGKLTDPKKLASTIRAAADFRERFNVPVWCNQLGRKTGDDRDLAHMRSALEQFAEARIGFAWWQNRQNTGDPDEYAQRYKTPDGSGWIDKMNEIALLSEFLHAGSRTRH